MKIIKVLALITAGLLLIVVIGSTYINYAFPRVNKTAVVNLNIPGASLERGKYLAHHVAVCMDCHSKRDWNVFSGPMVRGSEGIGGEKFSREAGFPGEIYAPNLTPYHLSGWTDNEIYQAICAGIGKDGRAIFPLMAYKRFGKMATEDIYSIILYIRSLQPLTNQLPQTAIDFPVSLLNKLGPADPTPQALPDTSNRIAYGAYLINAAGCVDCHSKVNKGVIVEGTAFSGGMEFKQPAGIIRAPNITMHQATGIGSWTKELFIQKFKAYENTGNLQKLKTNELNTPMPWNMYAGMKESDLEAIYLYLKSLTPKENAVAVREYLKYR
ncbi:c-type cytochrome [Niabella aquatica]